MINGDYDLSQEDKTILDKIKKEEIQPLTGLSFKKLEKKRLKEVTLKEDRIVKNNNTANMSETKNLIEATSLWVARQLGLRKSIINYFNWWVKECSATGFTLK